MEDSHIVDPKVTDNIAVFGVFDGHGGNFNSFFIIKN